MDLAGMAQRLMPGAALRAARDLWTALTVAAAMAVLGVMRHVWQS